MAEIVSSAGYAVAQEAVNQALSTIKERYDEKSDAKEHIERIEMAHIKLEATLEESDKWNNASVPLLRWRSKLKRVAQECDDMLRSCKWRLQEEQEIEDRVRGASFPKRILHSARSLVSSIFNHSNNEVGRSTVQQIERMADSANEFLMYMEFGGTPRRYSFFDPFVRHLLAGKGTRYGFIQGSQQLTFLLLPLNLPEHGIEVRLQFLLEDCIEPENNFLLGLCIRLSESIDIVGVTVRCLQLLTPHFKSTAETVMIKLTQIPTQDFCWVPSYSISSPRKLIEHWDNLHTIFSQWSRPNPLCCQQHDHYYLQSYAGSSTRSSLESLAYDTCLEQVTQVYLQSHVALSSGHKRRRRTDPDGEACPTRDFHFPYLKLTGLFSPHASYEDLSPAIGGSAIEMINGEATQRCQYSNISFAQLGEIVLPKAVDCLRGNAAATSYQLQWKTKHGGAYLRVEETSWRATKQKGRGGKRQQWSVEKAKGWTSGIAEFFGSWVAHAPSHLQGSVADWVQKEKQMPGMR